MLRWFYCDAGIVETRECIEKCPLDHRCLTRPTLVAMAKEREWTGKPSTTQLLNGTMHSWLKLTKDYGVKPESKAFMLLGTQHHKKLEDVARELGMQAEIVVKNEKISGIADLLDMENGEVILNDYKTFGSFKVAKCLGLQPMGKKLWVVSDSAKDMMNEELQLNKYRIDLEDELGLKIDKMQIQITVRDGGLYTAFNLGIMNNMYLVQVKRLEDENVRYYFSRKAEELLHALNDNKWDKVCDDHETWNGRRCGKYCEVAAWCPRGAGNK